MNLQYVNQTVKQISQAMSQPIIQSISLWALANQPIVCHTVSQSVIEPVN